MREWGGGPRVLPLPPVFLWIEGAQQVLTSRMDDIHRFETRMKSIWRRILSFPRGTRSVLISSSVRQVEYPSAYLTFHFGGGVEMVGVEESGSIVAEAAAEAHGDSLLADLGAGPRILPWIHSPRYLERTDLPAKQPKASAALASEDFDGPMKVATDLFLWGLKKVFAAQRPYRRIMAIKSSTSDLL